MAAGAFDDYEVPVGVYDEAFDLLGDVLLLCLAAGLPAWPAVLDALGTAGVALEPGRVGVSFGPVTVVADGRSAAHDERAAASVAAKAQVDLAVSRLGHQRLQSRPALRPVRHRAARRR
jgi:hypothetical protein